MENKSEGFESNVETDLDSKSMIRRWFSLLKRSTRESSEAGKVDRVELYNRNFKNVGEWRFSKEKLNSKQDFMNEITEDGKVLRTMGEEDGRIGVNPSAMKKIAENVASLWQSFIESCFQHKSSEADERLADSQEDYDTIQEEQQSLLAHKSLMDKHYKYNSKDYNKFLGYLYVTIAVFLIIADFPLSIQTTMNGFNLEYDEGVLLALGLVLMTVYIKILYDEFFGGAVQNILLESRPEILLGEDKIATEEESNRAVRINRIRAVIKIVILCLLICTIIILGTFRFDYLKAFVLKDGDSSSHMQEFMKLEIGRYAFILITLIFPLIGGICASVGFKHLRNVKGRKKIRKQLRRIKRKKEKALKELLFAKGKSEEYRGHLNWVTKQGDFLSDCADYFFSCYLHGYDKGMHENISEDLYSSAATIRSKAVAMEASDLFTRMVTRKPEPQGLYENYFDEKNIDV